MTTNILPQEFWKPVVGFEKFTLVSSHGRLLALPRERKLCNLGGPFVCTYPGYMMKQKLDRYGYLKVRLTDSDGKKNDCTVHRLVAKAFHANPDNKTQINHKDSNKTNNHVGNLEWCTVAENHQHAYKNGHHALNLHRCPVTGQNIGKQNNET